MIPPRETKLALTPVVIIIIIIVTNIMNAGVNSVSLRWAATDRDGMDSVLKIGWEQWERSSSYSESGIEAQRQEFSHRQYKKKQKCQAIGVHWPSVRYMRQECHGNTQKSCLCGMKFPAGTLEGWQRGETLYTIRLWPMRSIIFYV